MFGYCCKFELSTDSVSFMISGSGTGRFSKLCGALMFLFDDGAPDWVAASFAFELATLDFAWLPAFGELCFPMWLSSGVLLVFTSNANWKF